MKTLTPQGIEAFRELADNVKDKDLFTKFRQVYADCGIDETLPQKLFDARMEKGLEKRELSWKSSKRCSLLDAALLYAWIGQYNRFKSNMLVCLWEHFRKVDSDGNLTSNIKVTPAREHSVCVYLHIKKKSDQCDVEKFVTENFNADKVNFQNDETLRIWW